MALTASEIRAPRPLQLRVAVLLDQALGALPADPIAAQVLVARARELLEPPPRDESRASAGATGCVLPTWRARQIVAFVDDNIGRTLYSAELAGAAKMSTGQLGRALKATFGLSPSEFIMQRRLLMAQRLMLETDDALAQIAQLCGLCDQAHLSRAFRKAYGQTPAAWRRGARG
ncbi:helix-turn-helix transcriptional regulator [Caulobacter sp. CCH9-E1]|jgi:AraC family transcriptional regulator|uniref:helix-turn-helix transcriptional regulator n=1 Tax=Caulobacter sp. CCH9-E1 TaxID=1768768 RepID=UPI00082B3641|nr:AraC family transcriptional regulator [Caulobacter sp. CCH9-E1]